MCKKEHMTSTRTCQRGQKKQIFIEEKDPAKLHIAVINQARCSRPVWIISRLSARPGLCFLCSGSWLTSNQSTALFLLALFTFLSLWLRCSDQQRCSPLYQTKTTCFLLFGEVVDLCWGRCRHRTVIGYTSLSFLHLLLLPRCLFHTFNLQIPQIITAALVI